MRRRQLLTFGLALGLLPASRALGAEPHELEVVDLELEGDAKLARRARLLLPRSAGGALPLLVLLHGLGETKSAAAGLSAWTERYGLLDSYRRLCHPPLAPGRLGYLEERRRAALNEALARAPFRGFAVVCPVTPNVYERGAGALERYADWIESTLLPAVRGRAPIDARPGATAIDGCSLGGYVALEVFLRKPELFGCVGSVQGAFSAARAAAYAERIQAAAARVGARRVHVQSSTRDPYRAAAERLSRELARRRIEHALSISPGPHDQPWLREVGTLELLFWHDRAFERSA